jgi:hypothetical protein
MSPLNAPVFVPYQHNVSAVARVAKADLNLGAPLNPYPKAERPSTASTTGQSPRGRYSAQSAAPEFAAHILVEGGLSGTDPFARARGQKAYAPIALKAGQTRLTA